MFDENMEKAAKIIQAINDEYDSQWMIITIDSDSQESTTPQRDKVFEKHGFSRMSPKGLPLPESTYLGKVPSSDSGKEMVKMIWRDLKDSNLEPRRILGGVIDEWKVIRSRKDKD